MTFTDLCEVVESPGVPANNKTLASRRCQERVADSERQNAEHFPVALENASRRLTNALLGQAAPPGQLNPRPYDLDTASLHSLVHLAAAGDAGPAIRAQLETRFRRCVVANLERKLLLQIADVAFVDRLSPARLFDVAGDARFTDAEAELPRSRRFLVVAAFASEEPLVEFSRRSRERRERLAAELSSSSRRHLLELVDDDFASRRGFDDVSTSDLVAAASYVETLPLDNPLRKRLAEVEASIATRLRHLVALDLYADEMYTPVAMATRCYRRLAASSRGSTSDDARRFHLQMGLRERLRVEIQLKLGIHGNEYYSTGVGVLKDLEKTLMNAIDGVGCDVKRVIFDHSAVVLLRNGYELNTDKIAPNAIIPTPPEGERSTPFVFTGVNHPVVSSRRTTSVPVAAAVQPTNAQTVLPTARITSNSPAEPVDTHPAAPPTLRTKVPAPDPKGQSSPVLPTDKVII